MNLDKMTVKLGKLIKTVRVKPSEAEMLKEKAWQLSMESKELIKEPEIVHFLIEEFINEVEIKDGKIIRKVSK